MRKPRSSKSATPGPQQTEQATQNVPVFAGGVNIRGTACYGLPPHEHQVMATVQIYPLPKEDEDLLIGLFNALRDAAQKYLADAKVTDGTVVDVKPKGPPQ